MNSGMTLVPNSSICFFISYSGKNPWSEMIMNHSGSLEPFGVEVVFGVGHRREPQVFGQLGQIHHLVQHLLDLLGAMGNRPQSLALGRGGRHCGNELEHEFHALIIAGHHAIGTGSGSVL